MPPGRKEGSIAHTQALFLLRTPLAKFYSVRECLVPRLSRCLSSRTCRASTGRRPPAREELKRCRICRTRHAAFAVRSIY